MSRHRKTGVSGSAWREYFREAAKECKAEVSNLPKGERLRAYRACMSRKLKGGVAVHVK